MINDCGFNSKELAKAMANNHLFSYISVVKLINQTNTNMKKIAFFVLCIMVAIANIILLAIYKDCIIPTVLFSAFAFMWLLAAKNTDNIIK